MILGNTNLSGASEFVVQGITIDGQVFSLPEDWALPEDWVDHLCDMLSTTNIDKRTIYSEFVRPAIIGDVRSVVVQLEIKEKHPGAFDRITQFVGEHNLKVRLGRGKTATPVIAERRDPMRNNG
ncbi:hypothetical protein OYT1_ch1510 [Ferriphaselus amnicola]|uniref:Uncharacterized protein n=1 Tax=Ferriphaselus amnicola TaxID=1188319 RepID=A0A2Z6GCA9_9PROT|nr:DUF3579 domain-containing protein [Ferriphaselus amnicola]BBE51064.1 hypothetical protein OYT1_ch1510 [Ferriphaselus amnicola]